MGTTIKTVFRRVAIERYRKRRQESVLPILISPRTVLSLWILVGLLLVSILGAWITRVPSFVHGIAVIGDPSVMSAEITEVDAAVVIPADGRPGLSTGQPLLLDLPGGERRLRGRIVAVESAVCTPTDAARRFEDLPAIYCIVTQPVVIAHAAITGEPGAEQAPSYRGSVCEVAVTVGADRLASMLPLIGALFRA